MLLAGSSVFAQEEVIRIDTTLVNLNVVVKDRQGRRVRGLMREDFDVYEDGVRQEITHFVAEKRALRLVLLFDVSISMEAVLPTIKQEAIALLNTLHADDTVNIVSFATDVQKPSGWLSREQAADVIRNVVSEPHPQPVPASVGQHGYRIGDTNTYLYEAFRYVFHNFKADSDRIAVVMFSDGVDTGAGRVMPNIRQRADEIGREMVRQAQESWALIYPIRYKTEQAIGDLPASARRPFPPVFRIGLAPDDPGRKLFEKIAAASGGEVFEWTTPHELTAAVTNALDDLRSQYGIAYRPPSPNGERRLRRIRVRVKRPNLVVRTREVYFR
jgi:Ca-activated chloride channel family protein